MASPNPDIARRGVLRMLSARIDYVSKSIGHNLAQGMANEQAIRDLLVDAMPDHVGVGTGMIVGTDGNSSRQVDIVLFDKRQGNPMLSPLTHIFLADQVIAAVEIKTTYSVSALHVALENVESVKRLHVSSKRWAEWESDGAGGQVLIQYGGTPPLGIVLFLGAQLPDGPVDLDAHFTAMRDEINSFTLGLQPDLVVSATHASMFRHIGIGKQAAESQQFLVCCLQDPTTHEPLALDASADPGALVQLGNPPVGAGEFSAAMVSNLSETRQFAIARPKEFGDVHIFKTARVRDRLQLLDPGRCMLHAFETLEKLTRMKKLNSGWSLQEYWLITIEGVEV